MADDKPIAEGSDPALERQTFICYAHEDRMSARTLADKLRAAGAPIWFDQWEIRGGSDWDQAIDDALEQCTQMLIILTPAATKSLEVRGELQIAIEQGKRVIPVLFEECRIPRQLRVVQYIDMSRQDINGEDSIKELLRAMDSAPVCD